MNENTKKVIENTPVNAESKDKNAVGSKATPQKGATKQRNKPVAKEIKAEVKTEVKKDNEINLESMLNFEDKKKAPLSFNKNLSISNKLDILAQSKNEKVGKVLNSILVGIVDTEKKVCKVDIKEVAEKKVQNTYKVDETALTILKAEAEKRNMSLNDYLNKVLDVVLKDVK